MTVIEERRREYTSYLERSVYRAFGVVENRTFLHEELLRGSVRFFDPITVTMCGTGALGSWTSLFLADSGIKNFRLIDKDKVEEHNLSTQFFGRWNLGQTKVQALATELYRRHGCKVERHPIVLTEQNANALLAKSDLIICTFDNKASREIVQKTVAKLPRIINNFRSSFGLTEPSPCIMAGMHGSEYYMHVAWAENFTAPEDPVEHGIDPCNYPLGTSLAVTLSGLITETALHYLITGERKKVRMSLKEIFE